MKRETLSALLPHAVAVALFTLLASAYFSPVWKGYELRQGDIDHWRGMSKEISDYRLLNGEEPLWTNSMFGGMPAYQISTEHASNLLRPVMLIIRLGLPGPVGVLFLAMLGFYIFALCLRINPWLSMAGAVAFGFSTINILYLGAGHAAKVNAIALMPPVLGGLILAFRGKPALGSAVFMLFLGLHITANHLQMTYYLALLCGAVALGEMARLILERSFMSLVRTSAMLLVATGVAILPAMSNLLTTAEYSRYTTRGKSELTITAEGDEKDSSEKTGLETNYILDYNFAPGEQWSLFIPNAFGGESAPLGKNKEAIREVPRAMREQISQANQYWGAQRFTGGAFYFGAAIMMLFAAGLLLVRDTIRWPFLIVTLLALALCVKEQTALNEFFIGSFPLYNKFRDSKMVLVLIQIMAPAIALLFLQQVYRGELWPRDKRIVLGGIGLVLFIAVIAAASPGMIGSFISADEAEQFAQYEEEFAGNSDQLAMLTDYQDGLVAARKAVYSKDAGRSLLFGFLGIGLVALAWFRIAREAALGLALLAIAAIDLWTLDLRYLNNKKQKSEYEAYVKTDDKLIPYKPTSADMAILAEEEARAEGASELKKELLTRMQKSPAYQGVKNEELLEQVAAFGALGLQSNYRVLNLSNPFNDAATSYYHKSIGGYHGAKLKSYQEVIDFYLQNEVGLVIDSLKARNPLGALAQTRIANMLNARYVVYNPEAPPLANPFALGNAWFVQELVEAKDADDEISLLAEIDPARQAVCRSDMMELLGSASPVDSTAAVQLDEYAPNKLSYECTSSGGGIVVFSETYYPEGWVCRIDGQELPTARVNYILRAVRVPEGDHTIEWSFEPAVWEQGSQISMAGSCLLYLLLGAAGFSVYRDNKKRRQDLKS